MHNVFVGDEFSAKFLIENQANVNAASVEEKETALHLVATFDPKVTTPEVMEGMANVARLLVQKGANTNAQDKDGK